LMISSVVCLFFFILVLGYSQNLTFAMAQFLAVNSVAYIELGELGGTKNAGARPNFDLNKTSSPLSSRCFDLWCSFLLRRRNTWLEMARLTSSETVQRPRQFGEASILHPSARAPICSHFMYRFILHLNLRSCTFLSFRTRRSHAALLSLLSRLARTPG
jgi:hypothetical protein